MNRATSVRPHRAHSQLTSSFTRGSAAIFTAPKWRAGRFYVQFMSL